MSWSFSIFLKVVIAIVIANAGVAQAQKPRLVVQTSAGAGFVRFIRDGKSLVSVGGSLKLWDVATRRELRRQPLYDSEIAISHDDTILATEGLEKTVQIFELSTGRLITTLTGIAPLFGGSQLDIEKLAFSPDGRHLVATASNQIRIWDIKSNAEVRTVKFGEDSSHWSKAIAISPDGRFLASGTNQIKGVAKIVIWEIATGVQQWTVDAHKADVRCIAFSRDGKILATGSDDKTVKLWDAAKGTSLGTLSGHPNIIQSIAFSPDSKRLASSSQGAYRKREGYEAMLKVWDVERKKEWRTFGKAEGISGITVTSVDFAPDGASMAIGGSFDFIEIVSLSAGKVVARIEGKSTPMYSVGFKPTGDQLAIAFGGWITALWNLTKAQAPVILRDPETPFFLPSEVSSGIRFPVYSPDGNLLADGTADRTIKLWDPRSGQLKKTLTGHTEWVWSEAFSPDGKRLASGSNDQTVRLWNVSTGTQMAILKGHSASVNIVAFSPDGKTLASGSDDNLIKLWKVESSTELRTLKGHQGSVRFLAFAPDGKTLASIATDGTIRLWSVESGEMKAGLTYTTNIFGDVSSGFGIFPGAVRTVAFSLDGKLLAAGFGSRTIVLWDTASGKVARVLEGHIGGVGSVAFSPDGRRLVSASDDREIKLWDVENGREICSLVVLDEHRGDWIVVTPDGHFDTSGFDDITSLHWVLPEDPFTPLPLEIFMRDYYEPRLLPRLLAAETLRPVRDLATLNRTQPKVTITGIQQHAANEDLVDVSVEVADAISEIQRSANGDPLRSGVYDLRLFRDGQLVSYQPVQNGEIRLPTGRDSFTFSVRLPRKDCLFSPDAQCFGGRRMVEFSAYAFNRDRVKSNTARQTYEMPRRPIVIDPSGKTHMPGRAYVITVGVDLTTADWRLGFARNGAVEVERLLKERLAQQYEVVPVQLLSAYKEDSIVDFATKGNLRTVLNILAGRSVIAADRQNIPNERQLQRATPDDLVVLYIASHGYADPRGKFYVIPSDNGEPKGVTEESLDRCLKNSEQSADCEDERKFLQFSISSDELTQWIEGIDARQMVLVLDSCHSGAVSGPGFKPGPMGDRGFGQLSYDKGMLVLAATQSQQFDFGTLELGDRSLLTYALTQQLPATELFNLREWLSQAEKRVPELYKRLVKPTQSPTSRTELNQEPALFDFSRRNLGLAPPMFRQPR